MPVVEVSVPALLRERASLQPDDTAFTFIDYEQDWAGVAESLTWPQLYRRALNVARELRLCASPGDRAVILAPQGLDYIVAFLGALQAGLIAVPLSVPLGGVTDERVDSVLRDASPAAVLTTSPVIGNVTAHVMPQPGKSIPPVIEVDLLDLDAPIRSDAGEDSHQTTAYLQYTSGSTRQPAGVMISHTNLGDQFRAADVRLFSAQRRHCATGHHYCVVAAVLPRHGFGSGGLRTDSGRISRCAHQPGVVPGAPGPVDAIAGKQSSRVFGGTELRLRTGGTQNIRRRHGRA